MTLRECIESVDELIPNSFSNETKTKWLNEVEGKVQTEVFLLGPEEIKTYTYDECAEHELLVDPPHSKLYEPYLIAKIQFANGEYGAYQNTFQMFNQFWNEFVCYFARLYRPADTR